MDHVIKNGIVIVRTPTGIGVGRESLLPPETPLGPLVVEIEQAAHGGKLVKREYLHPVNDLPWRDYYGKDIDHTKLVIRVRDGGVVLAELGTVDDPARDFYQYMLPRAEQLHVTENFVSVPPALIITDERNDVWTLGFNDVPSQQAPEGEYAFDVLKNGAKTGEIASRIEMRNGKVRILTRRGYKVLSYDGAFFM